MSTPGSDVGEIFASSDIAIAGSGVGELFDGPEIAVAAATAVSSWGFVWTCESIKVWRRGEVAWAQILGTVLVTRDGAEDLVPYWTTGVFGRECDHWVWLYWGGAEPQNPARV
jgi:hypothetical protein